MMPKILIAYDGSDCSEKAISDLKLAGMPKKAEAVVLTVVDSVLLQMSGGISSAETTSPFYCSHLKIEKEKLQEAKEVSRQAVDKLRLYFPEWKITGEAAPNYPLWGLVDKIEAWKPDLVVMGSHGRSGVGRVLFGSNTHGILAHVHCNLRICRGQHREISPAEQMRILVAFDGSQESETAFKAALCREWPKNTRIKIVTAVDTAVTAAFISPTAPIRYWLRNEDMNPVAWIDRMFVDQKNKIEQRGFVADSEILKGDPKRAILQEAENWRADCVFLGSRGLTGRHRILAGSVSTAVAMHAPCSVEVVHQLWSETSCCGKALDQHRDCMSKEAERKKLGNWAY